MLHSVITTISKPGKDPALVQNYRPMSLINSDVKLYAKVIAHRRIPLPPTLIHPKQVGFIPGWQAPDATRKLLSLIHSLECKKMPSLLLSLDAEKMFDRVHWGFLQKVLQKFGITGWLQKVILSLCFSPSARMVTDGVLSKPFDITNGTRQGHTVPHYLCTPH